MTVRLTLPATKLKKQFRRHVVLSMKTCKAGYCTVAILPLLDGLFSSRMLAPAALALRVRECYFDPLR